MNYYRVRTYIAGDWDHDKEFIDKIYEWNEGDKWKLCFSDAHCLMQARDSSLACSIKKSLRLRLKASKTFILIVGSKTRSLRKGNCMYCERYNSFHCYQYYNDSLDTRSFVEFECELAIKYKLNIIVIYNSTKINKLWCPDILRNVGIHIEGKIMTDDNELKYNYQAINDAIMKF